TNPDVIVSSYLFHSHSLAKWRRCEHLNFKLVTVVADPWTFNPISFVPEADMHLVYDDVAVKKSKKFNIEPDKVMATGWWTRQEMFKEYNKKEARKKMGFKDNRPVIFVGGGSLGTNALPKVLPMLLMVEKPIGVIFNSGTDKLAYNMVEEYERMFKRLRKNDMVQIANLGWIENMAEVLNACDIVFGKAGPNFLFDVAATKRPFVAITHIGGQEDGNIDIIENKKLGWVKERSRDLTKFFLRYTQNPEEFNLKYIENIKAEADRNEKSLPKVLEIVKKM
ncbi:MAG TPA: glycosyltransferase, partial [Patescibacteria group bacterium]